MSEVHEHSVLFKFNFHLQFKKLKQEKMEVNQYITFMQMIFRILFRWIYGYYSGHMSGTISGMKCRFFLKYAFT